MGGPRIEKSGLNGPYYIKNSEGTRQKLSR